MSWTAATNEVNNIAHWVATHRYEDGCIVAAAAIVGIALSEMGRRRKEDRLRSAENAKRFNTTPEPPVFDYPPPTPETRAPR